MSAMRSEELYGQKLLITNMGGRFMIGEKNGPTRPGHNDFELRRGKNTWNFVIVNSMEECTIWVPH